MAFNVGISRTTGTRRIVDVGGISKPVTEANRDEYARSTRNEMRYQLKKNGVTVSWIIERYKAVAKKISTPGASGTDVRNGLVAVERLNNMLERSMDSHPEEQQETKQLPANMNLADLAELIDQFQTYKKRLETVQAREQSRHVPADLPSGAES